jgi:hypothetical protein
MVDQMTRQLKDPILDGGIENTNYFNGRLLTAADLQTDQTANREQHGQLGQAIGAGVVQGLQVSLIDDGSTGNSPVVRVTSGLAFNHLGYALGLSADSQVALTRQLQTPPADAQLFAPCTPPKSGATPINAGIYILVAYPASGYLGKAPMRSFGSNGQVTGCGSKYAVEGIQFRLVELPLTAAALPRVSAATIAMLNNLLAASGTPSLSKLRNLVAHLCFGTEELIGFVQDPLSRTAGQSPYTTYGALDDLHINGTLTDCDVPIALLYWTSLGVQFLDMWSVRRGLVQPQHSAVWPLPVSERRRVEAEAIFLQFQEQMNWIVQRPDLTSIQLASIRASDYFRYLPPAGLLALGQGAFRGIDPANFFDQLPHRPPIFIDGAVVRALMTEALPYEPIDLTAGELMWVYKSWQNAKAIDDGATLQPYVIFSNGLMPYMALARFDVARWDYSNYVDRVDWDQGNT